MPYVICVNQPGYLPESDPVAVATLDEAREQARECVGTSADALGEEQAARDYFRAAEGEADALPEQGGVIQLPDGYVVDVRVVTWDELADLAGFSSTRHTHDEILDAYNRAS